MLVSADAFIAQRKQTSAAKAAAIIAV